MKRNKGFTLIELIIVVAILGILMAIAIPSYNGMTRNAKTAAARAFATQVNTFVYGEGVNERIMTGTFKFPTVNYITLARITDNAGTGTGIDDAGTGDFVAQWKITTGTGTAADDDFIIFEYIPDTDYQVAYVANQGQAASPPRGPFDAYGVAMTINGTEADTPEIPGDAPGGPAAAVNNVQWVGIGSQGTEYDDGGKIKAIIDAG